MSQLVWDLSSELPRYSSPAPLPSYSCEPACGERRLDHTPRPRGSRSPPTSSFIKKAGRTTIILNEQEEGVNTPTYGRQSVISGALCLEQGHNVLQVVLKVEGKLDSTISEGGSRSIKLINDTYTLWSSERDPDSCPDSISFSVLLPSTFKDGESSTPLPPSYHHHFYGSPTLMVRSIYRLHIIVSRTRHQKIDLWPKKKHILVPFTYAPRTRAHRPIIPSPCFFSSVKTSPEEWYQAVTCLKIRPNAPVGPLICHIFVPAGRIYGLRDTIPFHVQLTGSISSLRRAFEVSPLGRVASADSERTVDLTKNNCGKPFVHVKLVRQISVSTRGEIAWRNTTLAEGTINPVPPELPSCQCDMRTGCRESHVDWEGELRCPDDVVVGGFDAGNVYVKDFIALSVLPPNPITSPFLEMQVSVPIRLVTDSFLDTTSFDTAAQ